MGKLLENQLHYCCWLLLTCPRILDKLTAATKNMASLLTEQKRLRRARQQDEYKFQLAICDGDKPLLA